VLWALVKRMVFFFFFVGFGGGGGGGCGIFDFIMSRT